MLPDAAGQLRNQYDLERNSNLAAEWGEVADRLQGYWEGKNGVSK